MHRRRAVLFSTKSVLIENTTATTFLDGMCGADNALRRQVELLLAKEEQAGSFLELPAMEDTALAIPTKVHARTPFRPL